ncbi:hypothetical protein [Variovorax sp.]|uniref:hypothetical protein n=1 Tax=Variovorax sp. TaxID=1871043 RepID=UPI002D402CD3|nr:hypothetical protein [Variovorax sp.]HYP81708.1 hypothetical protein [Variovorax sp.]
MSATQAPRSRKLRTWLVLLLVLLAPVLSVGGYVAFERQPDDPPRLDLPPFDSAKAARLSPQKRAAYEQELFSEIPSWSLGSRRYPNPADSAKREQRWMQMANDGFELAYITLRVLSPATLEEYSMRGPMKRLEALAEQGDTGAMCLMTALASGGEEYVQLYKKWLERGAALGHPECMIRLGGKLLSGDDGYPKDVHRGLALEFAARRKSGYVHLVGSLTQHFEKPIRRLQPPSGLRRPDGKLVLDLGYGKRADIRRLYCWRQVQSQTWDRDTAAAILRRLRVGASLDDRPELRVIYEDLRDKHYTLEDCLNMGMGGQDQ